MSKDTIRVVVCGDEGMRFFVIWIASDSNLI